MTTIDQGRRVRDSRVITSTGFVHSGDNLPHWSDHARYEKARRLRRLEGRPPMLIDATGTHRRLRALMAIGWRARDLAPRIGWASGELDTLFRRPTVTRRTAAAVHAVYDALSDTPGPSEQTRRRAARSGYLGPLWWDDDTIDDPAHDPHVGADDEDADPVVVDRLVTGERTPANRAERVAAFRVLLGQGLSPTTAGARLSISSAYVRKYAEEATA